jgi:5-methylcytosine-specific restriction endonuclease McrA
VRRTVLRAQPFCAEPGCHEPAAEVDHIVALADGGDPWSTANLQGLCHRHHAAKTGREVFGRARRRVYTR